MRRSGWFAALAGAVHYRDFDVPMERIVENTAYVDQRRMRVTAGLVGREDLERRDRHRRRPRAPELPGEPCVRDDRCRERGREAQHRRHPLVRSAGRVGFIYLGDRETTMLARRPGCALPSGEVWKIVDHEGR
jgi:hypothetical protein